jgi:hypothetical protein
MITDNVDKGMLNCVEILKKNTDRKSRTLYNVDSLDVSIAITRLLHVDNKQYLALYDSWLNQKMEDVELTQTVIDNSEQIQ